MKKLWCYVGGEGGGNLSTKMYYIYIYILVVEVIVILLINHLHCRGGEKAFIHDAGMSVFNFCDL